MDEPVPVPPKKGLLEGVNALIALGAGIIGVWGAYTTVIVQINDDKLKDVQSQLSHLQGDRDWAKEIYSQYDLVVREKDPDEQVRIDRLSGLLMLAQLMDEDRPELKSTAVATIHAQISRYKTMLKAEQDAAPTVEGKAQLVQYETLEQQARTAASPWGVVIGQDVAKAAAEDEVKRAVKAGFHETRIFERKGRFVTVVQFAGEAQAKEALADIRKLSRYSVGAFVVRIGPWCDAESYDVPDIKCRRT